MWIVLLLVLGIALSALMSSTFNSGDVLKIGPGKANQAKATAVINQAESIRSAMLNMSTETGLSLATITLDGTATTGLYGADGYLSQPTPLTKSLTAPAAWTYSANILPGVGSAALDNVITIANIQETVCKAINIEAGAPAAKALPPLISGLMSATADLSTLLVTADSDLTGLRFGCVATAAGAYSAYAVVDAK